METSSKRPAQEESSAADAGSGYWRTQLHRGARQTMVNKIMDTLKSRLPISVPEDLNELQKIASLFEEEICTAATSQSDYLKKISLKILSVETKTQHTPPINPSMSNTAAPNQNPTDPASLNNQGESLTIHMVNPPAAGQQLLPQNFQNNTSAAVQSSTNLPSSLSSITGLSRSNISSVGQMSNLQNMPGISQNSVTHSVGPVAAPGIYANARRQMQERQQQQQIISQRQQQSEDQHMYQHQLQQQLLEQKLQHSSHVQQHTQQQQQHTQQQQLLSQPTQLQSSQQNLMQISLGLQSAQSTIQQAQPVTMQSAAQPGLQQNQLNSIQQSMSFLLQQHPQLVATQQQQQQHHYHHQQQQHQQQKQQPQPSIHQQAPSLQQQPTPVPWQSDLPLRQQLKLIGQQANILNMQQVQLLEQQNNVPDMQQQQQRLPVQQNSLLGMQQPQLMLNPQSISIHQQQQLGPQSNISGLWQQQQQLLGSLPNVSNMQSHQCSMNIMQQPETVTHQRQQTLQTSLALLQPHGQQSQHQSSQQQLISQFQTQPAQLQQQPNSLQQEIRPRLQALGALLQSQNVMEQLKQSVWAQRVLPEVSSSASGDSTAQIGHAGLVDLQEEIYQKVKSMREMYLADLNELYQKTALKLQQHASLLPPTEQSEQYEKMKNFKIMLGCIIAVLQISKNNILPGLKEELPLYEKRIVDVLAANKKKIMTSQLHRQQQFQHPGGLAHSMPQQQPSEVSQLQQDDNQPNQVQQMNLQSLATSMQLAVATGVRHVSMPLPTQLGVPTTQQNISDALQPGSNLSSVQGGPFNSLQQGAICSMQQDGVGSVPSAISAPQQTNANTLPNNSMYISQPNSSLMQLSSDTLQQQHLRQQQLLMQTQGMKQQLQQHHMEQLFQQQQMQLLMQSQPSLQQRVDQQQKQQLAQIAAHQMPQHHEENEPSESKVRSGLGIKPSLYQQHVSAGRYPGYYYHHQLKQGTTGASFPISSPQHLQASSPQISHHSSPQVNQHSLSPSQVKAGTPLPLASSLFVPSPCTPLAPSSVSADSEKQLSGISLLTNARHIGHQQSALAPPQALATGRCEISSSPFLAEYTSPDGSQANATSVAPDKTSASEWPLEHLTKVVKSSTPNALSSAICDIGSVASMIDRQAGSAPGNGSMTAVDEDLVALTKCFLQARNFMSQDGNATMKKMKRTTSAMLLNNVTSAGSVNDSFKQSYGRDTSESESTATSCIKRHKIEVNHALLEEIREINQQLIDMEVNISEEDADSTAAAYGEGTVIKCSFTAVACSASFKPQFASSQKSAVLPLKLLVPMNYPKCSPILLDKFPDESSEESDDLYVEAKSRFSVSLRGLSQPMSLGEMARTWDACARKVIAEYAQQTGRGSFSSKHGAWENCVGA